MQYAGTVAGTATEFQGIVIVITLGSTGFLLLILTATAITCTCICHRVRTSRRKCKDTGEISVYGLHPTRKGKGSLDA